MSISISLCLFQTQNMMFIKMNVCPKKKIIRAGIKISFCTVLNEQSPGVGS